jgi:anti-anti-sigma factor
MNRREDRTWRLSIEGERRDGVLVLTVAGRLDAASSGDLTDRLMDSVNTGVVRIVIDLSGVDYISSAGLLAIDAMAARIHAAGGALVLCGLTEPVRIAFDLAGLLRHLVVEPSSDAAVQRLRS